MPVEGQSVNGKLMSSIYHGGVAYKVLLLLCLSYFDNYLWWGNGFDDNFYTQYEASNLFILVFTIYLTGGVLFHLIWETKSQYIYPYVYLLLPLTAYGLHSLYNVLPNKISSYLKNT